MASLRDRLGRNPVSQYFANLPAIDRATAYIVLVLLSALVACLAGLMRHRTTVGEAPALTAPPFEMQFAAAARRWPA